MAVYDWDSKIHFHYSVNPLSLMYNLSDCTKVIRETKSYMGTGLITYFGTSILIT